MKKKTYKEVKEIIESFGYTLLSKEYKDNKTKLKMLCPSGHECYISLGNFHSNNRRCVKCKHIKNGNKKRYTYEYVKEYIESFGYKLISDEYKNNKERLEMLCPKGHKTEISFDCFKNRNHRCIHCHVSEGEKRIMKWLDNKNIKYFHNEPYFDNLLSPLGNPLRPDFIIENKKIWIEYDGEFHYKKQYENDGYENLIKNDEIKNNYANENSWNLIRIPYWELENIEKILEEELK